MEPTRVGKRKRDFPEAKQQECFRVPRSRAAAFATPLALSPWVLDSLCAVAGGARPIPHLKGPKDGAAAAVRPVPNHPSLSASSEPGSILHTGDGDTPVQCHLSSSAGDSAPAAREEVPSELGARPSRPSRRSAGRGRCQGPSRPLIGWCRRAERLRGRRLVSEAGRRRQVIRGSVPAATCGGAGTRVGGGGKRAPGSGAAAAAGDAGVAGRSGGDRTREAVSERREPGRGGGLGRRTRAREGLRSEGRPSPAPSSSALPATVACSVPCSGAQPAPGSGDSARSPGRPPQRPERGSAAGPAAHSGALRAPAPAPQRPRPTHPWISNSRSRVACF
nr:translation initiation factor IF-2-like [Symphalangus syndactylus]